VAERGDPAEDHLGSAPPSRRFTVVIPTRGRPELLEAAVRSARVSGDAYVIVVVDAAESTEADHLADAQSVVVLASGGVGAAGSRNVGASAARTHWLIFLDDDDLLEPNALASIATALDDSTTEVGIVFGAVALWTHGDRRRVQPASDFGPLFHSVRLQLLAGGFCVHKSVFDAVGGYADGLEYSENTELLLRAVQHCHGEGLATLATDTVLATIRERPSGQRSAHNPLALKNSAELMLARHAEAFQRDPASEATYHRIAGVNSARLQLRKEARNHFRMAASLGGAFDDRLRAAVATVPLFWRLVWPPGGQ
jgi:glycosyltransferase involved in cell wall biosynthesis